MVGELLPAVKYETNRMVAGVESWKICIQVNFLVEVEVEVEDGKSKINPDEHSEAVWASESEVRGVEMTDGMRGLVEQAFAHQFVIKKS